MRLGNIILLAIELARAYKATIVIGTLLLALISYLLSRDKETAAALTGILTGVAKMMETMASSKNLLSQTPNLLTSKQQNNNDNNNIGSFAAR